MPKSMPCTKWGLSQESASCKQQMHELRDRKIPSYHARRLEMQYMKHTIFLAANKCHFNKCLTSTSVSFNKCLTSTSASLQQVSHFNKYLTQQVYYFNKRLTSTSVSLIKCLTSTSVSLQQVDHLTSVSLSKCLTQ